MNVNSIHTYARVQGLGRMIVSMDAIFGLPRKKAAGQSIRAPLHGHLFFYDQTVIDEYVESAFQQRFTSHKVYVLISTDASVYPWQ